VNFRELEKIIKADGWRLKNAEGSHYQYVHPDKPGKVTIPYRSGDLGKKVVISVMKQAKLP
jgi:predicted RNA binding protein YcfA (HicA-like mRNA interferase family)